MMPAESDNTNVPEATRRKRVTRGLARPLSTGSRELGVFFRKITRCSCTKNTRSSTPDSPRSPVDVGFVDGGEAAESRLLIPLLNSGKGDGHECEHENDVARHFDLSSIKFIDDEKPSIDGTHFFFFFSRG